MPISRCTLERDVERSMPDRTSSKERVKLNAAQQEKVYATLVPDFHASFTQRCSIMHDDRLPTEKTMCNRNILLSTGSHRSWESKPKETTTIFDTEP